MLPYIQPFYIISTIIFNNFSIKAWIIIINAQAPYIMYAHTAKLHHYFGEENIYTSTYLLLSSMSAILINAVRLKG